MNDFYTSCFLPAARKHGHCPALTDAETGQMLSYAQLSDAIDARAADFSQAGIADAVFALAGYDGADLLINLLAVWKTGSTAVLIADSLPADDISHQIDTSRAGIILSKTAIPLQAPWQASDLAGGTLYRAAARPDSWKQTVGEPIALVVFTSGTTDAAKGVLLSHDNLIHAARSMREAVAIPENEKVLLALALTHMYGLSVALTYLAAAGHVFHLPHTASPEDIRTCAAENGIAGLPLQPRHLSQLAQAESAAPFPSSLRYMASASASLDLRVLNTLAEAAPHASFYIYYALTEVPRAALIKNPHLLPAPQRSTIGRAAPFMQMSLDPMGDMADGKTFGEIILRGRMVAFGYLKKGQAGIEPIPDGIFHTGDLGYTDEDGLFFWCGRRNDIIYLDGISINPWSIERALSHISGIAEVIAVPLPAPAAQMAAIFTLKPADAGRKQDIAASIRSLMPDIAVYAAQDLPRNAQGKILRSNIALSALERII